MSIEDIVFGLLKLGFKENEAKTYLALLEGGMQNVASLAKRTGIPRPTVYHLLETLMKQSLVSSVQKNDKFFFAEPPERIRTLLAFQMRELEEKRTLADQLLLRLQVFHNTSEQKPRIRYIESIDGLRAMQHEYEKMPGDIIQLLNYDRFLQIHDPMITNAHRKENVQVKRRVRSILITNKPDVAVHWGAEVAIVPEGIFEAGGEMTVCGDRLVLFAYSAGFIAVEIISEAIASTARATLELAWREAEKIGKKISPP